MSNSSVIDISAIAAAVIAARDTSIQIAPFSSSVAGFGLADAYRVTPKVRQLREATGERVVGRKIGFTNRTIWDEFGVHAPIWGYVYDRTLGDLRMMGEGFSLARLSEPLIEPEIIFQLSAAPDPDMDERDLLSCIAWVSHGFEIVQSIYPGWKFAPADTVAAFGLHGALLIGERHPLDGSADAWLERLHNFEITLACGDTVVGGHSRNVLDGPLSALRHLVEVLAKDSVNPPLAPGEIITTGTLTRALPIKSGETWTTKLSGVPLSGASIRFC